MTRNKKIALLLAILLGLTTLLAVVLSTYFNPFSPIGSGQISSPNSPFSPRTQTNPAGDYELYYMFRTILSTVNIVLTAVLIFNYVGIYLKTRSEFTFGLLLFAAMLLIKDITLNPIIIGLGGFGLSGLGPFAFIPDLFEMTALLVLFYLSVKY
jgi:hypothetical protein